MARFNIQTSYVFRETKNGEFDFYCCIEKCAKKDALIIALERLVINSYVRFIEDDLYIKKPENFSDILETFTEYNNEGDFVGYSDKIVDYLYKHHSVKFKHPVNKNRIA